jgi:anaerobic C4-dicarboxylate transporter DcuA
MIFLQLKEGYMPGFSANASGEVQMPSMIMMIMLAAAGLIILFAKTTPAQVTKTSLFSSAGQAATTKALMPLGLALGMSPAFLVGIFPAVNGHFFVPGYPTQLTAIQFDRTGTTHIGKYVLNHSFMLPGLVITITSVMAGSLLQSILM